MGSNSAIRFSEMENAGSRSSSQERLEYKLFQMLEKENSFVIDMKYALGTISAIYFSEMEKTGSYSYVTDDMEACERHQGW